MARRRRRVNVSEAIRDYVTEFPDAKPKEASQAISALIGRKVSPIYVSNVKTLMKRKTTTPRQGQKGGAKAANATNHMFDIPTLEGLMKVVRRVGKQTAKRLLDLFDDAPS